MENAATMGTLLHEMGLVLQGLIDSGYSEQFERIMRLSPRLDNFY